MLVPDIDEFTLVLWDKDIELIEIKDWNKIAHGIMEQFVEQTLLEEFFGSYINSNGGLPGYTYTFTFDNQPFNGLHMGWHEINKKMGIAISFSASAWLYYRKHFKEHYGTDVTVADFLKLAQSDDWKARLSRIDFLVDFKDEGMSVDGIYRSIERGTAHVLYDNGKRNPSTPETISKDGVIQTFYLGSRKKNTGLRFRLYDKKQEQIAKGRAALRLPEAESLNDWVRLEVIFRGTYAHNLHEELLKVQNHNDLKNLIVGAILSKYQFWYIKSKKMMKFTKDMNDMLNTSVYEFENPKMRTVELEKMIDYHIKGSGILPLIHKLEQTFGDGTGKDFLNWLYEMYYNGYEPSKDDIAWLNKHKTLYQKEYFDPISKTWREMPWEGVASKHGVRTK